MFIYSIYDKKSVCHKSQFFAQSDADAVRTLARITNDSRSDVNMFPDDFALYCLGELNINDGSLSGIVPVKFICEAMSLIKIDKTE